MLKLSVWADIRVKYREMVERGSIEDITTVVNTGGEHVAELSQTHGASIYPEDDYSTYSRNEELQVCNLDCPSRVSDWIFAD